MLAKVALIKFAHGLIVSTCHVTKQPQTAINFGKVSRQPNRSNTPGNREGGIASWQLRLQGPVWPRLDPLVRKDYKVSLPLFQTLCDCENLGKAYLTYHTPIPLKDGRVADSENTPMSQNVRYGGGMSPLRGVGGMSAMSVMTV